MVRRKLKTGLASLSKLKDLLRQSKLAQAHKALFESYLGYINVIWGNVSYAKLSRLQTLQNRTSKVIQSANIGMDGSAIGLTSVP